MTVEDVTYQQRLEEVLRDKIEEQIHSVRQEPNEIGCGKYVENILAYTLEAINALNREMIEASSYMQITLTDGSIRKTALDAELRRRFGVDS